MKLIFIFGFLLMLTSCGTVREFEYSDGPDVDDKTIVEKLDPNGYTIYLRQICTSDDKAKETYVDCSLDSAHNGLKKLEIEYLFISNADDRIIYITNFPDKYEYIYNNSEYRFKNNVNVNIWYFSKIYVGKIEKATGIITFRKNQKKSMIIRYEKPSQYSIQFNLLTETKNGKSVERKMSALKPPPSFSAYPTYRLMLNQYNVGRPPTEKPVDIIDNALVFVKGKGIYFELAANWDDHHQKWIRYKYHRLVTRF